MSGDHNMFASGSGDGQRSGWRKRTIMEMAREADIKFKTDVFRSDFCDGVYEDDFERFAALVREDEREACAEICDRFQARDVGMQPAECAGAIRARGQA